MREKPKAAPVSPAVVPAAAPAGVPQRQTLPPTAGSTQSEPSAAADITSESNFNQAKTPGEQHASAKAATNEAAAQVAAHPGGLPLPTSGQPLTKPEPDADYGSRDDKK